MSKPKCDCKLSLDGQAHLPCGADAVIRIGSQNLCDRHAPQNVAAMKEVAYIASKRSEIPEPLRRMLEEAIAALEPKP